MKNSVTSKETVNTVGNIWDDVSPQLNSIYNKGHFIAEMLFIQVKVQKFYQETVIQLSKVKLILAPLTDIL